MHVNRLCCELYEYIYIIYSSICRFISHVRMTASFPDWRLDFHDFSINIVLFYFVERTEMIQLCMLLLKFFVGTKVNWLAITWIHRSTIRIPTLLKLTSNLASSNRSTFVPIIPFFGEKIVKHLSVDVGPSCFFCVILFIFLLLVLYNLCLLCFLLFSAN